MQSEDQNNLYVQLHDYIPKSVLSSKNKAKSWSYGYNEKYDVVIISKDGTLGEIISINGLIIGLPLAPKNIKILLLQVNQNVMEIRENYTWFFAGSIDKNIGKNHTGAGVAIIISKELTGYIWDVQSYSDRLISITLGYAIPISFRSAYMYTAAASSEDKSKCYNKLKEIKTKLQNSGPTYTGVTSTPEYK